MKKNIFISAALLVWFIQASIAQNTNQGELEIHVSSYSMQDHHVVIHADIRLDHLQVGTNDVITITPLIRSLDGTDTLELAPLLIVGSKRKRVNQRAAALGKYAYPQHAVAILERNHSTPQTYFYALQASYQSWMRNSELIFMETATGCACVDKGGNLHLGGKLQLPTPHTPEFRLAYLVPQVEGVKHRAASYAASLDYAVNQTEVNRSFKQNSAVLDEVDQVMQEVKADPNIELKKIVVTGYASPDGSVAYNTVLSEKRARAFADYLTRKHHLLGNLMEISWKGEDWMGLRTRIDESAYAFRSEALQIIDSLTDINRRKAALKKLQGGRAYSILLHTDFEVLRRNSYELFYTVRGLDLEQSKALIQVKPEQLSLNEMFRVATSYERGSEAFKNAFEIALTLYPEDPIARFNKYTAEIETGSVTGDLLKLPAIECAEAWNNLGVVFFQKGESDRAVGYFERASEAGLQEAIHNLSQYKQWLESNW